VVAELPTGVTVGVADRLSTAVPLTVLPLTVLLRDDVDVAELHQRLEK
jgi:hypothetical protein